MIVNSEGWALTAGHVVGGAVEARDQVVARRASEPAATGSSPVVHHAEIWALPDFERLKPQASEAIVDPLSDLALVKLSPLDPSLLAALPCFRTPSEQIVPGLSVCRLGFPFYAVASGYDAAGDRFELEPNAFPVPRFALDGIVSRFRNQVAEDGRAAKFIETSTPGLRGQSGGPLLDVQGRVCGVQSHTVHLDLGFDARYERDGRPIVERQFLNVGAATHVENVMTFLNEQGIVYAVG